MDEDQLQELIAQAEALGDWLGDDLTLQPRHRESDDEGDEDEDEDDDYEDDAATKSATREPDDDDVMEIEGGAGGSDKRGRGKKTTRGGKGSRGMTHEQRSQMTKANMLYTADRHAEAAEILVELVRQAPRAPEPYRTLAHIYEEQRDARRALELDVIATLFMPRDASRWEDWRALLERSRSLPEAAPTITSYCAERWAKAAPNMPEALRERGRTRSAAGDHQRASEDFAEALRTLEGAEAEVASRTGGDAATFRRETVTDLAVEYHALGRSDEAIATLERWESAHGGGGAMESLEDWLHVANIHVELLLAGGLLHEAAALIDRTRGMLNGAPLPLQLVVAHGTCMARLGDLASAMAEFNQLFNHEVADVGALFFEVAETLIQVGEHDSARPFLEHLCASPEWDKPLIWLRLAKVHSLTGRTDDAISWYTKLVANQPTSCEYTMALADLRVSKHEDDEAISVLDLFIEATEAAASAVEVEDPSKKKKLAVTAADRVRVDRVKVLVMKANILYELKRYQPFLDVCMPIIDGCKNGSVKSIPRRRRGRQRKNPNAAPKPKTSATEDSDALFLKRRRMSTRQTRKSAGTVDVGAAVNEESAESTTEESDEPDQEEQEGGEVEEDEEEEESDSRSSDESWNKRTKRKKPRERAAAVVPADVEDDTIVTPVPPPPVAVEPQSAPISLAAAMDASSARPVPMQVLQPEAAITAAAAAAAAEDEMLTLSSGAQPLRTFDEFEVPPKQPSTAAKPANAMEAKRTKTTKKPRRKTHSALTPLLEILGQMDFYSLVIHICKALLLFERNDEARDLFTMSKKCYHDCGNIPAEAQALMVKLKILFMGFLFEIELYNDAYKEVRKLLLDVNNEGNNVLWNLLNRIFVKSGIYFQESPQRFLVRGLEKLPKAYPMLMFVANHCLMSGSYGLAIAEYAKAAEVRNDDPMLFLCLGIAMLMRSMNRRLPDRNLAIVQAFTFLYRYAEMRGKSTQEAKYNLARAHHQLGIYHIAEKLYNEVLASKTLQQSESDLKMEAAYNLSRLYMDVGSPQLARYILQTYLVV